MGSLAGSIDDCPDAVKGPGRRSEGGQGFARRVPSQERLPSGILGAIGTRRGTGARSIATPMPRRTFPIVPAGWTARVILAVTGLVPVLVLGFLVAAVLSPRRAFLEVTVDRVGVRRALYGRTWSRDEVMAPEVRVADWRREPALAPAIRTNGTAFPGYAEGWFRLRGGQRALVFATGATVVVAPLRDGTVLLFGATDVEAAAAALRDGGVGDYPLAPPTSGGLWLVFTLGAFLLLPTGVLLFFLGRAATRTRVELERGTLRIRGMFPGKPTSIAALRLDDARIVDLTRDRALRPRIRTWGAGMPGFLAGWCRLANGEKALAQLTRRDRVLYLPTRLGHSLLLSVADPETLLAVLREPGPGLRR
jgi:hypothetical protein